MAKESPTPVGRTSDSNWEQPEHYDKATGIVFQMQEDASGTLGVLLTLAEVALGNSPVIEQYKDQIKREFSLMRNRFQDNVYYNLGVQDKWYTPGNVYLQTREDKV